MKSFSLLWVGLGLAAFALFLDEAYEWSHDSAKTYTKTRANLVRSALSNAEPADTLVLGDSISEMTSLEGLCGKTFNASVAGAKVGDVASLAPYAIQRTHPKLIVLEVGTNHYHADGNLSDFKRQYWALVSSLPGRKILVGVPNSPAASSFVQSVARNVDAAYVEPVTGKLTRDDAPSHPTPEGAAVYRQRIQQACVDGVRPS